MHVRCRRTEARPAAIPAIVATVVVATAVVAATATPAAGWSRTTAMQCYTRTWGSTATATCHNPDPEDVRMRLHIRCDRWWDPSVDSAASAVGPAQTVVLTGRCWKEIRSVWVTPAP